MRVSSILLVSLALVCVSLVSGLPVHSDSDRSALEATATSTVQGVNTNIITLTPAQRRQIATIKATCPFIGTAVATGALPVRNSIDFPLASIDDVRKLGNTGGGNLGEVLKVFAAGNQNKMRDSVKSTRLDKPVPAGFFSLDFPASQGSHPGHSGILQGNPTQIDSGRFSKKDFDRLKSFAKNGYITRSAIGRFIASNLRQDKSSKVGANSVGPLLRDTGKFFTNLFTSAASNAQTITKIAGENNLVGSSGEFGLLLSFLAEGGNTKQIDGEIAVSLDDVTKMFVNKEFPTNWQFWKKEGAAWIAHSTGLAASAAKAYAFGPK